VPFCMHTSFVRSRRSRQLRGAGVQLALRPGRCAHGTAPLVPSRRMTLRMRSRAMGGPQLAENSPYDRTAESGSRQSNRATKAELRSLYEMFITMNQLPKREGASLQLYTDGYTSGQAQQSLTKNTRSHRTPRVEV
jgi:hypothetical protein